MIEAGVPSTGDVTVRCVALCASHRGSHGRAPPEVPRNAERAQSKGRA
jgi:hypothetical protein